MPNGSQQTNYPNVDKHVGKVKYRKSNQPKIEKVDHFSGGKSIDAIPDRPS